MGNNTRRDGRVEPGQKITRAFSARAWNRAQDAADLVLGERPRFGAGPNQPFGLPQIKCKLSRSGYYGEVATLALNEVPLDQAAGEPTMPADKDSMADFSAAEKLVVRPILPEIQAVSTAENPFAPQFTPLFICAGNDVNDWVVSGFAVTRVRVFSYRHRYARMPGKIIDGNDPDETYESDSYEGFLDSGFWGPVYVVGYLVEPSVSEGEDAGPPQFKHFEDERENEMQFPDHEFRWALVYF